MLSVSWLARKPPSNTKREEYHLTAKDGDLQSKTMLLNGVPLELGDAGSIPAMDPVLVAVDSPVHLAPTSIAFVVLPKFEAKACSWHMSSWNKYFCCSMPWNVPSAYFVKEIIWRGDKNGKALLCEEEATLWIVILRPQATADKLAWVKAHRARFSAGLPFRLACSGPQIFSLAFPLPKRLLTTVILTKKRGSVWFDSRDSHGTGTGCTTSAALVLSARGWLARSLVAKQRLSEHWSTQKLRLGNLRTPSKQTWWPQYLVKFSQEAKRFCLKQRKFTSCRQATEWRSDIKKTAWRSLIQPCLSIGSTMGVT